MEKSWPVPVSVTVCGLPVALSVMVRVPLLVPLVVGSKKTPIVQFAFGGTLFVQLLSVAKSAVLLATLVMVRVADPVLVTVKVCGSPDVPTY
jgi:hypothetical protein